MIGLIACCAQKDTRVLPARKLYTSPLFRMSLEFAEPLCTDVYVMSAFHHLVPIDTVIHPYDRKLPTRKKELALWGQITAESVISRHGVNIEVLVFAGKDYAHPVIRRLMTCQGHGKLPPKNGIVNRGDGWRGVDEDNIYEPLDGMMIGQRLSWLKSRLADRAAGMEHETMLGIIRRHQ